MMIPRILHQTWKTAEVPPHWADFARSWRALHPGWEHRLWTDEDNRDFIARRFPGFLATYDAYRYDIQRADAVRYFLLYTYGGVYVDLDFECIQALDPLLVERRFVAAAEPDSHSSAHGETRVVCNAFMASVPEHGLLEAVIDHLRCARSNALTHQDVLRTTGPIMLTRVLEGYAGDDVTVLPYTVLYPFLNGSPQLEQLARDGGPARLIRAWCRRNGVYAVHHWSNSWVGELAGTLHNPAPGDVPGFVFFAGWDSPGNDVDNAGRDVPQTARACAARADAVCFNTDGFIKSAVRPRGEWLPMGSGDGREGFYVKIEHATAFVVGPPSDD
jgi:hypothetical protein